jgi:hypothetical protein
MEAMSTKAMDTRRQMGGVNAGKESSLAVNKQVKQLENRLEKVRTRDVSQRRIALFRTMRCKCVESACCILAVLSFFSRQMLRACLARESVLSKQEPLTRKRSKTPRARASSTAKSHRRCAFSLICWRGVKDAPCFVVGAEVFLKTKCFRRVESVDLL